jgi:hypothetical protein
MQICVYLLNRLIKDDYLENVFKNHDKKWGEIEFDFNDNGYLKTSRKNILTEKDKIQEEKQFKILYEKEKALRQQDLDHLFKIMQKNMFTWWD